MTEPEKTFSELRAEAYADPVRGAHIAKLRAELEAAQERYASTVEEVEGEVTAPYVVDHEVMDAARASRQGRVDEEADLVVDDRPTAETTGPGHDEAARRLDRTSQRNLGWRSDDEVPVIHGDMNSATATGFLPAPAPGLQLEVGQRVVVDDDDGGTYDAVVVDTPHPDEVIVRLDWDSYRHDGD